MKTTLKQLMLFSFSGVIGFAVDAGIVMAMIRLVGINLITAQIVAFMVAVTVTWAINRRFTFRNKKSLNKFKEWLKYLGANAFGGAVNNAVFTVLVINSFVFAKNPVLAIASGSFAGLLFNFSSAKILIFKHNNIDNSVG